MFRFNAKRNDYWIVYESLIKYYPIGVSSEYWPETYDDYQGSKSIKKVIDEKIFDKSEYKKWEDFIDSLDLKEEYKLTENSNSSSPAYRSSIILHEDVLNDCTRIKEVEFFLSLICPVYTIVASDRNIIKSDKNSFAIRSVNSNTVSPINEYKEIFNLLTERIESNFPGYRFLPNFICAQVIEGLMPPWTNNSSASVMECLFIPRFEFSKNIIGDINYKEEVWRIEGADLEPTWTTS